MSALVDVDGLTIDFGDNPVVDGVSFNIAAGEPIALVGESGSGKSLTALALARLLPQGSRVSGEIRFDGTPVNTMSGKALQTLRGAGIGYVFQDPTASLDPVFSVGDQLAEVIRIHRPAERQVREAAVTELARVGIPDPARRHRHYPHQFSGGQQQRIGIALALAGQPRLLVADEPTTALDTPVQAEIMALLKHLQADTGLAVLLITHNLALVSGFARRTLVMHQGRLVEQGDTAQILHQPQHAYTRRLLACIPRLGERRDRLATGLDMP